MIGDDDETEKQGAAELKNKNINTSSIQAALSIIDHQNRFGEI